MIDEPASPEGGAKAEASGSGEVRQQVIRGVFIVAARGIGIRLLGLASNVVLARLLTPDDFGVVALGLTIVAFASVATDIGLGAGLIRGPHEPTRHELASVLGFQMGLTLFIAIALSLAAALFGGRPLVIAALLAWCLPLGSLDLSNSIVLERNLRFGPLAVAELLQTVISAATSIALVVAGAGVFGLAIGSMIGTALASGYLIAIGPVGLVRPRLDSGVLRRLAGFGAAFQAANLANLARDQGVVIITGIAGSLTLLGYWSLVFRIMQAPALLFESMWRVSFPGIARMLEQDDDPRADMEQGLRLGTYVSAVALVGLAAASHPLIGAVFGPRWEPASPTVSLAAIALLIGGPVSVVSAGFLYAVGKARQVLVGNVLQVATWFTVLIALIPSMGLRAHGIAWILASIADATVLVVALRAEIKLSVVKAVAPGTALAVACGAAGYALTHDEGASLAVGLGTAAAATAVFVGLGAVLLRKETELAVRLVRRLIRRTRSSDPAPVGEPMA